MDPLFTVLIVEDDPILRALMTDDLQEHGSFKVLVAASARAAFDQLATVTPDLVILDLVLPDRSGYEVAEHIRREPRTREVPVLAVSARLLPPIGRRPRRQAPPPSCPSRTSSAT